MMDTAALIEEHKGLVHWQAHRYAWSGAAHDDLVQEGILGLMRAAELFDESRGVKFSTYATWWVRQKIGGFARKHVKHRAQSLDAPDRTGRRLGDKIVSTTALDPELQAAARKVLGTLGILESTVLKKRWNID